jgi:hypothetical protein
VAGPVSPSGRAGAQRRPSAAAVDRDLAGQGWPGPVGRPGRPPLIIRCCDDNQRSGGGRRPQPRHRPCPVAGVVRRVTGPGRGSVRSGGSAAAGQGIRAWAAGGPAKKELLDARRARRRPQPRRGREHLLSRAVWDEEAVRDDVRAYVVEHLGDPEAVLVVDETGISRKAPPRSGWVASTARMGEQDALGLGLTLASTGFVPHL